MKVSELPGDNRRELSMTVDLVQGDSVTVIFNHDGVDTVTKVEIDTLTYKADLFMQGVVP